MDFYENKILGAIFGQTLGNAVGILYESRQEDKLDVQLEWGADIDQLLIVMQSLCANGCNINQNDVAQKLQTWAIHGDDNLTKNHMLSNGLKLLLNEDKFTTDPVAAARNMWSNSNNKYASKDSLLRTSVLGCLNKPAADAENMVAQLSSITHVDPRCLASCSIHTNIIKSLIYETDQPDHILLAAARCAQAHLCPEEICNISTVVEKAYTMPIKYTELQDISKMGHVLKCMACGVYALHAIQVAIQKNKILCFKKLISKIAQEQGSSGANCAIAGAVLGAHLGYAALPMDWIKILSNHDWLFQQTQNFVAVIRGSK